MEPTWPHFNNNVNSSLDDNGYYLFGMNDHMDHSGFSPPFTTTEDSSDISLMIPNFPSMFSDEFIHFPRNVDELDISLSTDDFFLDFEEFEPISSGEIGEISGYLEDSEGSVPTQQLSVDGGHQWRLSPSIEPSDMSMDVTSIQPSLILPTEDMEIDNELSIIHLVKAYGEATEEEQTQLAEAIVECIREKVGPVGGIMERLLFYLFQPLDKEEDYIRQEAGKNFHAAFKAFYQIFPYGKFAHFAANLAILEAMPHEAEIIHIIDFDMGEGVQWSSMIEAIGQQREIRLTSIKCSAEDPDCDPSRWKFKETQRWLYDHARAFGVKLKLEERELHDVVSEIKRMKRRGGRREWLVFNCNVGLPHMGRGRSRREAMQFMSVAKDLLAYTSNGNNNTRGMVTFGDGEAWEKTRNCSSFESFLDGYVAHYQTLIESIERSFPIHLEARIAMECLFVAPFVSSIEWTQKWEEMKDCCDLQAGFGLEGWRVSKESFMEAKEMVREGESLYGVRVEGDTNNKLVLDWRGAPLVTVTCWRI
ncbi:protein NODULATION SIGNALING PATHWAY 2-like [Cornus florida]|uniref:protein NODULATION SIGNALING PATHWAY 2-like n=1 Tax=Cornus florida TaxID=4283 RepID=UPI00289BD3F2|nr:protein NODULATION SIGNALING PATHWAY 2-like [Cornus florida]